MGSRCPKQGRIPQVENPLQHNRFHDFGSRGNVRFGTFVTRVCRDPRKLPRNPFAIRGFSGVGFRIAPDHEGLETC